MKIQYTEGCTCDSLTINDVEAIEIPIEQVREAIKKVVNGITDIATLQQLLVTLAEYEGDYNDLGQCGTCGDFISEYTLEVPDE